MSIIPPINVFNGIRVPKGLTQFWRDVLDTALKAGIATFLAIGVPADLFHITQAEALSIGQRVGAAAVSAAVTVVISYLGKFVNDPSTPSVIPPESSK